MMQKSFLIGVLILFAGRSGAQSLSFYKENITMEIENNFFYVSGTYYLKGDVNSGCLLMFPFPADPVYGNIDSIYVFDLSENIMIDFERKGDSMILFRTDFRSGNELALQISYKQELLSTRAEYILETTRMWHKPLLQADYQLIIPDSKRITGFSIPPDDSIFTDNETIYFWTRNNYLPTLNMIFDFENKKVINE